MAWARSAAGRARAERRYGRRGVLDDGFEAVAALAQGQVERELAIGVEQIEGHEDDRDPRAPLVGDALAADALAEDGEGKCVCDRSPCGAKVPAEDFAVEDQRAGGVRCRRARRLRRARGSSR